MGVQQARFGVLGLFPGFSAIGGVQASGRLAWEAIVGASDSILYAERRAWDAYLFCYERNGKETHLNNDRTRYVSSKHHALVEPLRSRWPIHFVLVWHLGLLKLLPLFRLSNAKIALFLHGIESWRRQDWLTQILLGKVDCFFSNSEFTWQRFLKANPQYKDVPHRKINLGIGSPINGQTPTPTTPPAALMIGRLIKSEDYKGHSEVINAWPLVLGRVPDAELWIVGEGDLREKLERMATCRGLIGKIRFLGQVSEEIKQKLLANCRCLALPSRGEGFGLVYLEAMRTSRPCLVSTLDAGHEVVSPPFAGLAVDLNQPEQLANGLSKLLTPSPEWDKWSGQARQHYESAFTAKHFQDRLLSAISSFES